MTKLELVVLDQSKLISRGRNWNWCTKIRTNPLCFAALRTVSRSLRSLELPVEEFNYYLDDETVEILVGSNWWVEI